MNGWADVVALVTYNYIITASVVGIGLAFSLRDRNTSLYFFIVACDLIYSSMIHGYVRANDPEKLYRYLIWSLSEFLLLALIIYLAFYKNKINQKLTFYFSLIIMASVFALLYRLIDRHVHDLPYAYKIITNLTPLSNVLRVFIGYVPIAVLLVGFFKRTLNVFSNNSSDSNFSARHIGSSKNCN